MERRKLGLAAAVGVLLSAAFFAWMILPLDPFAVRSPDRSLTVVVRPADRQDPDSWLEIRMSGPANALKSVSVYGAPGGASVQTWQMNYNEFDRAWESVLRAAPPQEMRVDPGPDPTQPGSGPGGEIRLRGGTSERVYQYRGAMPEILRPMYDAARARPIPDQQ